METNLMPRVLVQTGAMGIAFVAWGVAIWLVGVDDSWFVSFAFEELVTAGVSFVIVGKGSLLISMRLAVAFMPASVRAASLELSPRFAELLHLESQDLANCRVQ